MLGYILLQARDDYEQKDMYDGRKHKFTKGNLYLGRYNNFGDFVVYDDNKDGCKFIQFRWCMGRRHPYYEDYFLPIEHNQVPNKKIFSTLLDVFTNNEYTIRNIVKGISESDNFNRIKLKNRDGKELGEVRYGYIYHDLENKKLCFEHEQGEMTIFNEEAVLFYNKTDNSLYLSI